MTRRSFLSSLAPLLLPASLLANTGKTHPGRGTAMSGPLERAFFALDPFDQRGVREQFDSAYSRIIRAGYRPVVFTVGVLGFEWLPALGHLADRLPTWPGEDWQGTIRREVAIDESGRMSPTGLAGFVCVPVA